MSILQLWRIKNPRNTRFPREHHTQTKGMHQMRQTLHHLRVPRNHRTHGPQKRRATPTLRRKQNHPRPTKSLRETPRHHEPNQCISRTGTSRPNAKRHEEVASRDIGDSIMSHLKKVDRVAYIRFASVYKQFEEPEDFRRLLSEVKKQW